MGEGNCLELLMTQLKKVATLLPFNPADLSTSSGREFYDALKIGATVLKTTTVINILSVLEI